MAKIKNAAPATDTVVYCGPTIPGVANQYTSYINGITTPLAEAIQKNPSLGGLVVPLEKLPEAMKQLHGGYGHIYRLYHLVQAKK